GGVMCACDRYAAARRNTSFSCSNSRTRLSALATSRRSSVSTGGGVTPRVWSRSFCTQSCNAERDIPISSLTWRWVIPAFTIATASRLNSSEYFLGIVNILPAQPPRSHAVKESTNPTADPPTHRPQYAPLHCHNPRRRRKKRLTPKPQHGRNERFPIHAPVLFDRYTPASRCIVLTQETPKSPTNYPRLSRCE